MEGIRHLHARSVGSGPPGHLQPGFGGETLYRLRKRQMVDAHREADHVAMRAAAKAVEEALVVIDGEGRRLLVVEGAESRILPSRGDTSHAPTDHFRAAEASPNLVKKPGRKGQALLLKVRGGERARNGAADDNTSRGRVGGIRQSPRRSKG